MKKKKKKKKKKKEKRDILQWYEEKREKKGKRMSCAGDTWARVEGVSSTATLIRLQHKVLEAGSRLICRLRKGKKKESLDHRIIFRTNHGPSERGALNYKLKIEKKVGCYYGSMGLWKGQVESTYHTYHQYDPSSAFSFAWVCMKQ